MTGHGRRVVVADDEMIMRQVLKAILKESRFEIVGEATHGDEVLAKCLQYRPDILCLDINMPRKDGIEALKEIRGQMPDLQVLMISANTASDKVKEAIRLGAMGFIVKPFNANQVLQRLLQLFGEAPDEKSHGRDESEGQNN